MTRRLELDAAALIHTQVVDDAVQPASRVADLLSAKQLRATEGNLPEPVRQRPRGRNQLSQKRGLSDCSVLIEACHHIYSPADSRLPVIAAGWLTEAPPGGQIVMESLDP